MPSNLLALPEARTLAPAALSVVALLLALAALLAARRTRRHLEREHARSESGQLEKELALLAERVARLEAELAALRQAAEHLDARQRRSLQAYALKRYAALGQNGAPPSQSLAFLTGESDGLVLTWIQTEHGCYVYAKEVQDGAPAGGLRLSQEEADALRAALAALPAAAAASASEAGPGGERARPLGGQEGRLGEEAGHR